MHCFLASVHFLLYQWWLDGGMTRDVSYNTGGGEVILQYPGVYKKSYFATKTHAVGTQKFYLQFRFIFFI